MSNTCRVDDLNREKDKCASEGAESDGPVSMWGDVTTVSGCGRICGSLTQRRTMRCSLNGS
jgi:hypothetical protein